MVKVINNRLNKDGGSLFHYAHFICDCLFPEVVNELYKHVKVIRKKTLHQTIGNFSKIYEEVMNVKNEELLEKEFNDIKETIITYPPRECYVKKDYETFRNYIFMRYNINETNFSKYPKVILIERGGRKNLIDDEYLKNINTNITTGKERREINNIENVKQYLNQIYENDFKCLRCEDLTFEEQVKYFYNAKLIICAHGAVMSNMFFCKEQTTIIEITCNTKWNFFDTMSNMLNLNHIKCEKNFLNDIKECLNNNSLKN